MSLSCSCDFDTEGCDWWWEGHSRPKIMPVLGRRKRCCSCGNLINPLEEVLEFYRHRETRDLIEESIHGDSVKIASDWTCEECSDLISAVDNLGMCYSLDTPIKDQIAEYMEAVRSYEKFIKENPEKAKTWVVEDFIGTVGDE
ncbi:MAG: hypothetical protein KZQ94_15885 [Candidatus Thiodiazotropha sp. (ex Troendleina suluensis)]|nr:hypothetical protein [Candidatus Thiodiazotropha sp. (ex Troendleina suluensis)]